MPFRIPKFNPGIPVDEWQPVGGRRTMSMDGGKGGMMNRVTGGNQKQHARSASAPVGKEWNKGEVAWPSLVENKDFTKRGKRISGNGNGANVEAIVHVAVGDKSVGGSDLVLAIATPLPVSAPPSPTSSDRLALFTAEDAVTSVNGNQTKLHPIVAPSRSHTSVIDAPDGISVATPPTDQPDAVVSSISDTGFVRSVTSNSKPAGSVMDQVAGGAAGMQEMPTPGIPVSYASRLGNGGDRRNSGGEGGRLWYSPGDPMMGNHALDTPMRVQRLKQIYEPPQRSTPKPIVLKPGAPLLFNNNRFNPLRSPSPSASHSIRHEPPPLAPTMPVPPPRQSSPPQWDERHPAERFRPLSEDSLNMLNRPPYIDTRFGHERAGNAGNQGWNLGRRSGMDDEEGRRRSWAGQTKNGRRRRRRNRRASAPEARGFSLGERCVACVLPLPEGHPARRDQLWGQLSQGTGTGFGDGVSGSWGSNAASPGHGRAKAPGLQGSSPSYVQAPTSQPRRRNPQQSYHQGPLGRAPPPMLRRSPVQSPHPSLSGFSFPQTPRPQNQQSLPPRQQALRVRPSQNRHEQWQTPAVLPPQFQNTPPARPPPLLQHQTLPTPTLRPESVPSAPRAEGRVARMAEQYERRMNHNRNQESPPGQMSSQPRLPVSSSAPEQRPSAQAPRMAANVTSQSDNAYDREGSLGTSYVVPLPIRQGSQRGAYQSPQSSVTSETLHPTAQSSPYTDSESHPSRSLATLASSAVPATSVAQYNHVDENKVARSKSCSSGKRTSVQSASRSETPPSLGKEPLRRSVADIVKGRSVQEPKNGRLYTLGSLPSMRRLSRPGGKVGEQGEAKAKGKALASEQASIKGGLVEQEHEVEDVAAVSQAAVSHAQAIHGSTSFQEMRKGGKEKEIEQSESDNGRVSEGRADHGRTSSPAPNGSATDVRAVIVNIPACSSGRKHITPAFPLAQRQAESGTSMAYVGKETAETSSTPPMSPKSQDEKEPGRPSPVSGEASASPVNRASNEVESLRPALRLDASVGGASHQSAPRNISRPTSSDVQLGRLFRVAPLVSRRPISQTNPQHLPFAASRSSAVTGLVEEATLADTQSANVVDAYQDPFDTVEETDTATPLIGALHGIAATSDASSGVLPTCGRSQNEQIASKSTERRSELEKDKMPAEATVAQDEGLTPIVTIRLPDDSARRVVEDGETPISRNRDSSLKRSVVPASVGPTHSGDLQPQPRPKRAASCEPEAATRSKLIAEFTRSPEKSSDELAISSLVKSLALKDEAICAARKRNRDLSIKLAGRQEQTVEKNQSLLKMQADHNVSYTINNAVIKSELQAMSNAMHRIGNATSGINIRISHLEETQAAQAAELRKRDKANAYLTFTAQTLIDTNIDLVKGREKLLKDIHDKELQATERSAEAEYAKRLLHQQRLHFTQECKQMEAKRASVEKQMRKATDIISSQKRDIAILVQMVADLRRDALKQRAHAMALEEQRKAQVSKLSSECDLHKRQLQAAQVTNSNYTARFGQPVRVIIPLEANAPAQAHNDSGAMPKETPVAIAPKRRQELIVAFLLFLFTLSAFALSNFYGMITRSDMILSIGDSYYASPSQRVFEWIEGCANQSIAALHHAFRSIATYAANLIGDSRSNDSTVSARKAPQTLSLATYFIDYILGPILSLMRPPGAQRVSNLTIDSWIKPIDDIHHNMGLQQ